jgi:hypothetical protein
VNEPVDDRTERPGVYARLAEEAEVREVIRTPPRWIPWAGRALALALAAGVIVGALRVHPW